MRWAYLLLVLLFLIYPICYIYGNEGDYVKQVDSLLNLMTLEEKIGQMNQITNDKKYTGPVIKDPNKLEEIKAGRVGAILNVTTIERSCQYQDAAMQSRLKIPLLFGLDVIHGMKTIFPIPLAEACSFDLELMEKTARVAASEASAHGIHWTFAPMVDIGRDARWGRVAEGAGEDTWYGSQVAVARIRGFQGSDFSDQSTVLACAKHFAGYGASIAGKDYNSVEISRNSLFQNYLPPFKAAVDAGVATFMNAFNDIDGIPATANSFLQRQILKAAWGFDGFVVSDWNSIGELVKHRVATDASEASIKAVSAGNDMDMVSLCYIKHLKKHVESGIISENLIDDAVRRILTKKFELGLFEDPYRYCKRPDDIFKRNRILAREAGRKSIVLLKNENQVLPIDNTLESIVLVGPLMNERKDMLGCWAAEGNADEVITIYEGMRNAFPDSKIDYVEGYDLNTNELRTIPDLKDYDLIIVAVGERSIESGESKSKVDINVNLQQQELVKRIKQSVKKPVVVLVMGGRPLIFDRMEPFTDAILFTWWLGLEAGNSIADVLSGKYNPSAKLVMTFPHHVGQCPIYYNYKSTGRPWTGKTHFTAGYIDMTNHPAYPFGYGLSYTRFKISPPIILKDRYRLGEKIIVTTCVENIGKYKGKETVQLYYQDMVSSLTRPVKELCAFKQLELLPGEKKNVTFELSTNDLGFYDANNDYIIETGQFKAYIGTNSMELMEASFYLEE